MDKTLSQVTDRRSTDQADNSFGSARLVAVLDYLCKSLEEAGEEFSGNRDRVQELKARLVEGRFHLAVLGQFKRGKSTLLNALLGEPLLPTSVVPLTSIPTYLRAGPKTAVRVSFLDGKNKEFSILTCGQAADILAQYVTEERNPANKLSVAWVEVEHPSPVLARGVVMIDTPGIGSTFRHNTEATLNFLPQCDVALFVVSADPPITEVEVEFLKAVREKVVRLFFVMNKIDYLTDDERIRAIDFFTRVIRERVGFNGSAPIFIISARQGLEAKLEGNEQLWQTSGLERVQAQLLDFLARDKAQALQVAVARKALDILADALMRIRLQRSSLKMPLDELERRIQIFEQMIREIEQERIKNEDLLAGDRKRALKFLEDEAEDLRQKARRQLEHLLDKVIQEEGDPSTMEVRARNRLAEEIPEFFESELGSVAHVVEGHIEESLRPYQDRLETLIETIRRTAAELFDIPYYPLVGSRVFQRTHEPYWVTHNWDTAIGALPKGFFDRFLPARVRQRKIKKRLLKDAQELVTCNVENIRWATVQNLNETFLRFASDLDERLRETMEASRGAIRAAHLRRKERAETVGPERQRLRHIENALTTVEEDLTPFTKSVA